ncbi:helix-turn-helix domain-containing protein [Streptomyces sp. NPDC052396]|uniref:helix-turn-helix domain-containing protein n=1 Tax=Streptomyces sp. NPDC052396 TaxID=3365689 RepID=UPI0037CFBBB2
METGQFPGVRQLRYAPAPGGESGVEVLDFARLRDMDPAGRRTRLQRPDFHVLALIASGSGRHSADFVDYPLRERTVVWIRPGVVHRWADAEELDGFLVLFAPGFLSAPGPAADAAADVFGPVCWESAEEVWPLCLGAVEHLGREYAAGVSAPSPASAPLLAHLLAALVLRVLPPSGPARPAGCAPEEHAVFRRYRAAVEEHFATRHQVADYASALGYGRRTLTRATRAATGLGAKQFLDQRILLEAQRLLAHTGLPVARCAERLGFPDAANFTTFFQRQTGVPPSRWRAGHGRAEVRLPSSRTGRP